VLAVLQRVVRFALCGNGGRCARLLRGKTRFSLGELGAAGHTRSCAQAGWVSRENNLGRQPVRGAQDSWFVRASREI
jgi:hypothetical protein